MKTDDSILSAVLDEDADFRDATLAQVKRLARRKRAGRVARRIFATATVVLVAGLVLWPRPETVPIPESPSVRIVHSSLPPMEVRSLAGGFAPVRTERMAFAAVEPPPVIRVFSTWDANPTLDYLDDRELLAVFPGRAMLVSPGTPDARLIIY